MQRSKNGQDFWFVLFDDKDRARMHLEFVSRIEAQKAADMARSVLVSALRCTRMLPPGRN